MTTLATLRYSLVAVVLATFAGGCTDDGPTTPTGTPRAANGEAFEVTGVVTDEQGVPMAGVDVTMRFQLGGRFGSASVLTDASGGYTIAFTSNPIRFGTGGGRSAGRAEIHAVDYDWYHRSVMATAPHLVENFRLNRLTRIPAGDSVVLSVGPDNGDCLGWLLGPCARARVTVPVNGNLTVEAVPTEVPAGLPAIEVCCVSGNEVGGNPVSLPVAAGAEIWVEVGQPAGPPGTNGSVSGPVVLKTSLEPS
jgi:hypothetical protein